MGTHPEVGGDEAVRVLLGVLHEDLVARGELRVDRVGRRGDEAATIVPGDPLADRGEELRHLAAIAGREDDATGLQAEVLVLLDVVQVEADTGLGPLRTGYRGVGDQRGRGAALDLAAVELVVDPVDQLGADPLAIGRASCRERVCPYVSISVVAVPLKDKKKYKQ